MSDRQKPKKAARDKALLLVGFAGAFRRNELVAIRREHLTQHSNGVETLLMRSKTDQSGAGRTVFPYANGDRCPVLALQEWLKISGIEAGYVFRGVDRHDRIAVEPLTAQSVALIIKDAIRKGLPGEPVREMLIEAVERRFGTVEAVPAGHRLGFLSDNGGAYIAADTRALARSLGLQPINTPVCSPQSNGMADAQGAVV